MKRAICIIRVSTVKQDLESQTIEIIQYAKDLGYAEDELIVIGSQGASARKLNAAYIKDMKTVHETIENTPTIEAVISWALDRIARKDDIMITFKNFLIERKINLIIKNPSLVLLNKDGSVNNGVELAINILAGISKQEMELKIERWAKTKRRNKLVGKYSGGRMIYGYTTDKDNYIIKHPIKSENVKQLFKLYSTGKYSMSALYEKIQAMGITDIPLRKIQVILAESQYYQQNENGVKYPKIINKELYDKCEAIRIGNRITQVKERKNICFALKILKCKECGANYVLRTRRFYKCLNQVHTELGHECHNILAMDKYNMDCLLLYIALFEHKYFVSTDKTTRINSIVKENEELQQMIEYTQSKLNNINDKIERANFMFFNGKSNKEQYEKMIKMVDEENKSLIKEIEVDEQKIENNKILISTLEAGNNRVNMFGDLTLQEMNEIVHTYCQSAYLDKDEPYNGKECVKITVNYKSFTIDGFEDRTRVFKYLRRSRKEKFIENGEIIDDSIRKMLGTLLVKIKANCPNG